MDKEKEEKYLNNMNGLNLELSQTKRLFNFNTNKGEGNKNGTQA